MLVTVMMLALARIVREQRSRAAMAAGLKCDVIVIFISKRGANDSAELFMCNNFFVFVQKSYSSGGKRSRDVQMIDDPRALDHLRWRLLKDWPLYSGKVFKAENY